MLLGIDHLVIACADPDAAAADLERDVGLRAGGGGRHDALGTFNRLAWLGDTYLELIGVFDRDLAERSWIGAPTVRALDAGGGLATWAVATDDIDADVARLRAHGADLGVPIAGERRRPDGTVVRWRLSAPPRLGPGLSPFLIQHDSTAAEWTSADRVARADGPARLTVLELAADDVNRESQAFLRALDLRFRPSLAGRGARDANLGAQIVRLVPGRAGGSRCTAHLEILDGAEGDHTTLGLTWRVRRPPA